MKKFKTPPDSPPIIVIDPDDQPMWSSTRTVAPTPSSAITQRPISTNFRIKDFLEISNLFQYGENQEESVMLRTFPFLLCEEAKIWLNELNEGTMTLWNELREAFISRYFSLAKFKRLLNDIHSFHQLDGPTQGILDTGGIFLYNTPNEAFKIFEDKVLFQLNFSGEFQISPKIVVFVGGSNIDSYHAMLKEKFKDLIIKIDFELLILRKELKEMQDGHRMQDGHKDNHASQIYMKDDTPKCESHEANYVQRYHRGYHDHEPINLYSYPNHNPNSHYPYPRNQMPRPSRYFEFTETSTEEMMREWMASQTEANERMKNQEFKSIVGDGIGVLTKKKIKKNDMGLSKDQVMEWNMKWKIDEWAKSQNLSSKQTDRTDTLPPHAHTEQVNVVFTGNGKSDDFLEIQIDQPSSIIVNNKIKKDKPIKTSKGVITWSKQKNILFQVMVKDDSWR
ncbi:reverse transcriptase domain-containing protein [Tanacetum coccineum]